MRDIFRTLVVVLAIASTHCDQYDAFRAWLREGGATFDNIDIKEFDNYGRSLVAIADIEVRQADVTPPFLFVINRSI